VIVAEKFVESLAQLGYDFWSGVPCSYLTPLLRSLALRDDVQHVNAANEGDAIAVCAGATLAGRKSLAFMQNSGLGNAVNPLSSLNVPFRIPVLLLITARGWPGGPRDEPQHRLMGAMTGPLLDQLQIRWEPLPEESTALTDALERAERCMSESRRPFAFIVSKDSFAASTTVPVARSPRAGRRLGTLTVDRELPERLPSRRSALERLVALTPPESTLVVSSTGYTSRELYAVADRPNHFYMVGSMGCASALGLGVSLACPDRRVVVVEGDGSVLMRLQNLAMASAYARRPLSHLVLDNGSHESTGGQPTLSAAIELADIAYACGYGSVHSGAELELIDGLLANDGSPWPRFAQLHIRCGVEGPLPRPSVDPTDLAERFSKHIASSGRSAGASQRWQA